MTVVMTLGLAWAAAILPLSPASATDHVSYGHKEGEFCTPCGTAQCNDIKNEIWVCKAATTSSCKWHTTGVCDNNVKAGEDINKNAEQAKKVAAERRRANEKRAADDKAADDKKAAEDRKKAEDRRKEDEKKEDRKKEDRKKEDRKKEDRKKEDRKKADEKKARDNNK
jgi:hypothetical protein